VLHFLGLKIYSVTDIFKGTPAPPLLSKPEEQGFRTVIRDGVSKGYGVFQGAVENERPGPNFAGHYIVIQWGCGTDCEEMAIVDAQTGRIYQPPFGGKSPSVYFSVPIRTFLRRPEFHLNSRLMIVPDACPQGQSDCATYYFVFENSRFRPIVAVPRDTRIGTKKADEVALQSGSQADATDPLIGKWEGSWNNFTGMDFDVGTFRFTSELQRGQLQGRFVPLEYKHIHLERKFPTSDEMQEKVTEVQKLSNRR
jgi:hypothetical protein